MPAIQMSRPPGILGPILAATMIALLSCQGAGVFEQGDKTTSKPADSRPEAGAPTREAACELTRIDSGIAWVSSYWGCTAPKLVYDGEAFYTVALWGQEQATAKGALYKCQAGKWVKGYEWPGLNYQPGVLLLDSQARLILIYPKMQAKPVILRSLGRGDVNNFEPLPVPDTIPLAGYLGAGICGDKLVIGYIGQPGAYSFNLAVLDLKTQQWSGPYLLAAEQRETEPFTTWLYPIIQPKEDGVHLVVTNHSGKVGNHYTYSSILYMYIPYSKIAEPPKPEVIVEMVPWTGGTVFGSSMFRAADGSIYVTALYHPSEKDKATRVYRRDPKTGAWDHCQISGVYGGAYIFENPDSPGVLWLTLTDKDAVLLFRSSHQGRNWEPRPAAGLPSAGIAGPWFLSGISPASGSTMPDAPCAVFSTGQPPASEIWFARFQAGKK